MNLHLDRNTFVDFIDNLNVRTGIAVDIIEKDYYVCLILKMSKHHGIELTNITD